MTALGFDALLEQVAERSAIKALEAFEQRPHSEPKPALIDQSGLARELGVSTRTVFAMRQQGLPVVMVCDSPRFELPEVLAWLRSR